jgi:hypothetical protein
LQGFGCVAATKPTKCSWSRSGCVSRPRCMLFPPVLLLSAAP